MQNPMKLYLFPNYCSRSPHIALREVGLPFGIEPIDVQKRTLPSGADFSGVNPKGAVPALEIEDGQVLTEGSAIVQYSADRHPNASLAPAWGTWADCYLFAILRWPQVFT